jgi:uncharacterized RDD family membrane protein YckC
MTEPPDSPAGNPDPNVQPPPPGTYAAPQPPPPPAPPPTGAYGYGQPAPGSVPPGMYQDPNSGLVLPQGVQLAPVGRRIGAYFLGILLAIVTLVIGYVIWGLVIWGKGQTPALSVLGMRVWHPESGRPAKFGRMALREIVGRFVEGIVGILTQLLSFVLFLATKEHKAVHDYIASTVVVYDPDKILAP